MFDKKFRKKNLKAYFVIGFNSLKLFWAIVGLIIGIVFMPFGVIFIALGIVEFVRYRKVNNAIDLIRDYGPLMVNHPEFCVSDYAKALRRDNERVVNEIKTMLKHKLLFAELDPSESKITVDEDYNLKFVLMQNGWASAVFVD